MVNKKWLGIVAGLAATGLVSLAGSTAVVYRMSMKSFDRNKRRSKQRSIAENTAAQNAWYLQQRLQEWTQTSQDGLILRASFIPAEQPSHRVAILAHGLGHSREQMISYAQVFHRWGYQVLLPDARAHGESDGTTIGYGWLDRHDYQAWIDQVIERCGAATQIVLMGISMGAATVLATAGETLPTNVKAVIADSGYASVLAEGRYRLRHKYHVPAVPALTLANQYAKVDAGYRLQDGDIAAQVRQTQLPILFIQGAADQTVPVENLDILYQAAAGPKQKYRHPSAGHIATRAADPQKYDQTVADFLARYVSEPAESD